MPYESLTRDQQHSYDDLRYLSLTLNETSESTLETFVISRPYDRRTLFKNMRVASCVWTIPMNQVWQFVIFSEDLEWIESIIPTIPAEFSTTSHFGPLHLAAITGNKAVFKLLERHFPANNPEAHRANDGMNLIHAAALGGNLELLFELIQTTGKPLASLERTANGLSVFHVLITHLHLLNAKVETIATFLQHYRAPDFIKDLMTRDNQSLLIFSASDARGHEIVELLYDIYPEIAERSAEEYNQLKKLFSYPRHSFDDIMTAVTLSWKTKILAGHVHAHRYLAGLTALADFDAKAQAALKECQAVLHPPVIAPVLPRTLTVSAPELSATHVRRSQRSTHPVKRLIIESERDDLPATKSQRLPFFENNRTEQVDLLSQHAKFKLLVDAAEAELAEAASAGLKVQSY